MTKKHRQIPKFYTRKEAARLNHSWQPSGKKGAASDVKRIDPKTGKVIEIIKTGGSKG